MKIYIYQFFHRKFNPSLYASPMRYYLLMKQDDKIRIYLFFGIPGSGKTNVLFKFLRQKILEEKRQCNGNMTESSPYEVISFNSFNICAEDMCRKICRMMSVPCKAGINKLPKDYSYSPDKTYFIDTSGKLGEQKTVYDFFSKSAFATKCILTVPAIIDISVLTGILEQYSFVKDFQIVLTFCDFAHDKKMNQISKFLEPQKIKIAGLNTSGTIDGSLDFL